MNSMESATKGIRRVYIDVMIDGRFVCQLPYMYCDLFPDNEETVKDYVRQKRPSLKDKDFQVLFSNNRV